MTDSVEVAIISESSGQSCSVSVWDTQTGSQLMTYKGGGVCASHSLTLLGSDYIVGAELSKPLIHVWPINSTEPSQALRAVSNGIVSALAASPDGLYIVAGIAEKIHLWQVEANRLMCVAARHFQTITCIRFLEDGMHFVSGGEDGVVAVWRISNLVSQEGAQLDTVYSFADHFLGVKDIHVGLGKHVRISSVSLDGSCRIYDFDSGKLLLSLIVDAVNLTSVWSDVLESSLFLGCGSGDILHVSLRESPRQVEHHLTEKERECTFKGHTKAVTALSTSQDSVTLLSGSADETARLWHIESKQCLRIIQQKGPVLNAFITICPLNMIAEKLEPNIVMRRLPRVNDGIQESFGLKVKTMGRLEPNFLPSFVKGLDSFNIANCSVSSEEFASKSQEMEMLERENSRLYKMLTDKAFNDNLKESPNVIPNLIDINLALKQIADKSLEIQPALYESSKDMKDKKKKKKSS
ncbi:WD repeat-containing protein 18 [Frankliniella fusca]|uniref:WD repeat-containing protein 18 n=1 Tax=Frankliniella fusca TaxID=407009 RepID=A0AAE1GSZ6_9NEOP|nr:WD repeat-containing protein 18 [Frankliniella fusca]